VTSPSSDRETTEILTKIGYLFLGNQDCHRISTEVRVYTWDDRNYEIEQDKHRIIDLIGVGYKYLSPSEQYKRTVNIGEHEYIENVVKEKILRGIEVKVSRSDFKRGFIHVGCNYNYLLIPKGLVDLSEVDTNIGVIEVDLNVFSIVKHRRPYKDQLKGVTVIRNPRFKKISERALSYAEADMSNKLTNQVLRWLKKELDALNKVKP